MATTVYKEEVIGRRVEVEFHCPNEPDQYFPGTIRKMLVEQETDGGSISIKHFVVFDDGDEEWYDLAKDLQIGVMRWCDTTTTTVKPVEAGASSLPQQQQQQEGEADTPQQNDAASPEAVTISPQKKTSATKNVRTAAIRRKQKQISAKATPKKKQSKKPTPPKREKEKEEEQESPPTESKRKATPPQKRNVRATPPKKKNVRAVTQEEEEEEETPEVHGPPPKKRKLNALPDPPDFKDLAKEEGLTSLAGIIRYMDRLEPGQNYYKRQQDTRGGCSGTRGKLVKYAKTYPEDPAILHWVQTKKWGPPTQEALDNLIALIKTGIQ